MKYTGRITALIIMITAIVVMRLYAYMYLKYPLTAFPMIGVIFLFFAFKAGENCDKVRFLSEKDSLTECHNRRFVNKIFPTLLAQMNNKNEELSLAILDCDNFKTINDTYGHNRGDFILREISALLLTSIRKSDMVARWGGDEFLIIAPYADRKDIKAIVNRFENELLKLSKKLQIDISVSSGCATYPRDAKKIDDLIHFADSNMYDGKSKRI
ncbi:Diguanylate cyclase/phosphodiesterase (GGDEF & EAL domains) [Candidatus Desulfosporosinus infrequens]|uniref:Diguanylate cyclase/phosphodiesterase (GGDEF & EAL domains) n=1 Tax=Candidatus Desulfosporosinus infrequens TaxID=2043169 RepID=A0A2U3LRZ0_9FIRM|nr:Diguanylate cyclase/phosphodiesterase (GGDEF & EAL domains) [Candidatus Desulfosporosinus infrequens]